MGRSRYLLRRLAVLNLSAAMVLGTIPAFVYAAELSETDVIIEEENVLVEEESAKEEEAEKALADAEDKEEASEGAYANEEDVSVDESISGVPDEVNPDYGPVPTSEDMEISEHTVTGLTDLGKTKTSIVIPDGVYKIGDSAFKGATFSSVSIPTSVTSIGSWAFAECKNITQIRIPSSVRSIGGFAFKGCSNLSKVDLQSVILESADWNIFNGCAISELKLYEGLRSLPNATFQNAGFVNYDLVLPESLEKIGNNCFDGCSGLDSVTFTGNNLVSIGSWAFAECKNITQIRIPGSVRSIGGFAFKGCSNLSKVDLQSVILESADWNIFNGCAISELKLYEGLRSLPNATFQNAGFVNYDLVLPESLEKIGNNCFDGCSGLDSVTFKGNNLVSIGSWAFAECKNITQIRIPSSVRSIGGFAFKGCSNLSKVDLQSVILESADWNIFNGCAISELKLYEGLRSLPNATFQNAGFVNYDLVLPESLEKIGNNCFDGCSGLDSVTFKGNNLVSIGSWAFAECKNITQIRIPSSVRSIGGFAFKGCSNLSKVDLQSVILESADWNIFNGCAISELKLYEGLRSLPNATFQNAGFVNYDLVLPESLEKIGNNCFDGCSGLDSVTFTGNNLVSIGSWAFAGCTNIREIHLPRSVKTIGGFAFNGCTLLGGELKIPFSVKSIGDNPFANCDFKCIVNNSRVPIYLPLKNDQTWDNYETGEKDIKSIARGIAILEGSSIIPSPLDTVGRDAIIVAGQKIDIMDACFSDITDGISRYKVSSKKIATISKGMLTGKKAGEVEVVAQIKIGKNNYEDLATGKVTVLNRPKLKFKSPMTYAGQAINGPDNFTTEDTNTLGATYWESSNPEVVEVTDPVAGILVARKAGKVKITAYFGEKGKNGTLKVTSNLYVKIPSFKKASYDIKTGGKLILTMNNVKASLNPAWETEDDTVAVATAHTNKNGALTGKVVVTGLKAGDTRLKAIINGQEYFCDIKVAAPTISKTKLTVKVNKTATISLKNTKLSKSSIEWFSTNPAVATVSTGGKIKGISKGEAIIYTEAGGVRNECVVTVK